MHSFTSFALCFFIGTAMSAAACAADDSSAPSKTHIGEEGRAGASDAASDGQNSSIGANAPSDASGSAILEAGVETSALPVSTNDAQTDAGEGEAQASLLDVAKILNGHRVECPCLGDRGDGNCDLASDVDVQRKMLQFGGEPNVVYNIVVHVRGLVEPNMYAGGAKGQGTEHFYVGGGKSDSPNYTWYSLIVTEPKQMYFFNAGRVNGHTHIKVDDHVTIQVKGRSSLFFGVNDQIAFNKSNPTGFGAIPDGHQVNNNPNDTVEGVPPYPKPFNGQFLQFDVESVTTAK